MTENPTPEATAPEAEADEEIATMPEEKKESSGEEIPMLDGSTTAEPVTEDIPIIGNIEGGVATASDGTDVTPEPEKELTKEEKERQDETLDMVEEAAWVMHQCVRAAVTVIREEMSECSNLMAQLGDGMDLQTIALQQPHTFIMANEMFKTVSAKVHYLDYEAASEDSSEQG